jgi:hypothetical protein
LIAHNDQASGSCGGGYMRPTNLNIDETKILTNNHILTTGILCCADG